MKRILRFLSLALLLMTSAPQLQADSCACACTYDCGSNLGCSDKDCDQCHSVYIPRSQHSNSAYFFLPPLTPACDDTAWHREGDIGLEYSHSFKSNDIAESLFGSKTLKFQGSQVANRDADALIADNFGLSYFFDGSISFKPRIQNVNVHFQERVSLNRWFPDFYGQMNITFAHQTRNLFADCGPCDPISTNTLNNAPFAQGYMTSGSQIISGADFVPNPAFPASGIKQALSGNFTFGDMQQPWKFGKFAFNEMNVNGLAGVSFMFGYNGWNNDCGHMDLFFIWVAPTGNAPDAGYVFAPVIGNGKHNEVGAGLNANYKVWENDCGTLNVYFNGNITTLIKNKQARSFDFKDRGCLSRYLLLKELDIIKNQTSAPASGFDYHGSLINGINFATRIAQVKVDIKGDASLRLRYETENYAFGIGYNLYGNSAEKICIITNSPCNALNPNVSYGVKGCTGVAMYRYESNATAINSGLTSPLLPLNATTSATITTCGSVDNPLDKSVPGAEPTNGILVDWTTALTNPFDAAHVPLNTLISAIEKAITSAPAKEVTTADLDVNSGRAPRQLTNKGFVTADYIWSSCEYKPYIGLGAEVEGGARVTDAKQWGFWIKMGATF